MPTYEYECQKCGFRFEEFQSITADPRKTCPKTKSPSGKCRGRVKRLIGTGGGLLFKGSGFYTTDYRSDGYQQAAKADKDGGAKSGGETKSGGEAKADSGKSKSGSDKSPAAKSD